MRKIKIVSMMVFFILLCSHFAFSDKKTTVGINGGIFAGTYGFGGEMLIPIKRIPNANLRVGLAVTDSRHLSPAQEWSRFAPLCVDAVYNIRDNVYVGAGLNYPIKVSDQDRANFGSEIFLGSEFILAGKKAFAEVGYSELRRIDKEPFKGAHAIFGYRLEIKDLPKIFAEVKATPEANTAAVEVALPKGDAIDSPKIETKQKLITKKKIVKVRKIAFNPKSKRQKIYSNRINVTRPVEKAEFIKKLNYKTKLKY